jgi:hypothetical protein
MFNAGPKNSIKNDRKNLKSKSDLVLKLYLTEDQKNWVERLSKDEQEPMSKCIANLIDAHRDEKRRDQKLDLILEDLQNLQRNQKSLLSNSAPQLEIILAYVKEIFRESSANLYRLNAVIDEFSESEKVRSEVNEYVRKQEATMRTKAIQIQEANL